MSRPYSNFLQISQECFLYFFFSNQAPKQHILSSYAYDTASFCNLKNASNKNKDIYSLWSFIGFT